MLELCYVVVQAEGAAVRPFKLMQTFPGQNITFCILKPLLFLVYISLANPLFIHP